MTIPDTQFYSQTASLNHYFTEQVNWIVSTKDQLKTVFVTHLGDIAQTFDTIEAEWQRATANMAILDSNNVPNNESPGNHDFANNGSSSVASYYDQYFPPSRYQGNSWYGGYLGDPNDGIADGGVNRMNKDNYELFSAGGMNFLIIHIELDMPSYAITWAQNVINAYPNRKVIISTHAFVNAAGNRGTSAVSRLDGQSAAAVWTNFISPNCQIFMVVNGHYHGQGRRTDNNSCGQPVFQLNSDYQDFANGGNGWLRYYTFKPSENKIYAYTYSPSLNSFDSPLTDDSFTLDWNMAGPSAYQVIGTVNGVASGAHATVPWNNLNQATQYEWYASVSDGSQTTTGSVSSFTTEVPPPTPPVVDSVSINQASPRTNDTLTVAVTSHDVNNDPITYQYQWSKNGTPIGGATGATLNLATAGNGDKGDAITVTVTANDGTANSAPKTSSAVTILNAAPTSTVALNTVNPAPGQVLTATATRADIDNDTVTLTYVWKQNGTVRKTTAATSSLTDTLDLSTIGAGNNDVITVELTPNDGTVNGTTQIGAATVNVPAVSAIPDSTFQVNGRVNAILRVGNRVYLGGDFTQLLGHNGEIVPRQYLAALDATTGAPVAWDPGGDGVCQRSGRLARRLHDLCGRHVQACGARLPGTGSRRSTPRRGAVRVLEPVRQRHRAHDRDEREHRVHRLAGSSSSPASPARAWPRSMPPRAPSFAWAPTANATVQNMVQAPDGRIMAVGELHHDQRVGQQLPGRPGPEHRRAAAVGRSPQPSRARASPSSPTRLFVGVGNGAAGNQVVAYDLANGNQLWVKTGDGDVVAVAVPERRRLRRRALRQHGRLAPWPPGRVRPGHRRRAHRTGRHPSTRRSPSSRWRRAATSCTSAASSRRCRGSGSSASPRSRARRRRTRRLSWTRS